MYINHVLIFADTWTIQIKAFKHWLLIFVFKDMGNIALGKPTELSSLYQNNVQFAGDKGNDGDVSGNLMFNDNNTCFHTDKERRPYWKVDLGDVYELQRMELYNRRDCCGIFIFFCYNPIFWHFFLKKKNVYLIIWSLCDMSLYLIIYQFISFIVLKWVPLIEYHPHYEYFPGIYSSNIIYLLLLLILLFLLLLHNHHQHQ